MKSLLDHKDYKLQFAGHETFTLRYGWLKKVFDAVYAIERAGNTDNSTIFTDSESIADFGVGKNMVQSMRHWALATGILASQSLDETTASRIAVTDLGRLIFDEKGDPYLEHPGSLWICIGISPPCRDALRLGTGLSTNSMSRVSIATC